MIVFLLYSGGVDSTFCLFIFTKLMFRICLLYLICWYSDNFVDCLFLNELFSVYDYFSLLNVKMYIFDMVNVYYSYVFSKLIKGINNSMILNSDLFCNSYVKFKLLSFFVFRYYFLCSSGHYIINSNKMISIPLDNLKDQSYFLSDVYISYIFGHLYPIGFHLKCNILLIMDFFCYDFVVNLSSKGMCFLGVSNFSMFVGKYVNIVSVLNFVGFNCDFSDVDDYFDGLYSLTVGQQYKDNFYLYSKFNHVLCFVSLNSTLMFTRYYLFVFYNGVVSFGKVFVKICSNSKLYLSYLYYLLDFYVLVFCYPLCRLSKGQILSVYSFCGILLGYFVV